MESSRRSTAAGFTLVEVLASTLLLLLLTGSMLSAYRFQVFSLKRQETQVDVQETARSVLDLMAREVRHAGYDPRCVKSFAGVSDARFHLLQIQFDRSADGVLGADETVTYAYDPASAQLLRTSGGLAVPLASDLGGASLGFGYFDGAGAPLTPSGIPAALTAAERAAVRRVRIVLRIERPGPEPANPIPVVSEFVTNVDLRNRFFNGSVGCP